MHAAEHNGRVVARVFGREPALLGRPPVRVRFLDRHGDTTADVHTFATVRAAKAFVAECVAEGLAGHGF